MIVVPTGWPTNADGTPILSPLAAAKALDVTYTNGAKGKLTRDITFTSYNETSGGEILDCLFEMGPYGWTAFRNNPGLANNLTLGADEDVTGFGDQGITVAPGEGYGGKTYADVIASGGAKIADYGARIANTRIAANCVNGKLTPLAGMESDADKTAQQRVAWDIFYQTFAQPDLTQPPAWVTTAQEP